MSAIALVTFIEIYDPKLVPTSGDIAGAIQHRFQNSEPTSVGITFNNAKFDFLSFIYQGATRSNDGNNLESTLILANESSDREGSLSANKLSMSYAAEAVDNGWSVRVSTCQMTDLTFSSVKTTLATDIWKITSMGYDNSSIEILLSSTIDAVGGNIGRFLTSSLVGHIPVTATIQTR
jgi:hypothetical protein|tara:strand:+ start:174 stop:707 length:534 start_codon:yes stop_codon:yes gene_type:complete